MQNDYKKLGITELQGEVRQKNWLIKKLKKKKASAEREISSLDPKRCGSIINDIMNFVSKLEGKIFALNNEVLYLYELISTKKQQEREE